MSVLWLLLILGSAVTVVTNAWRHGDLDLTGREANLRGVYLRAMAVGIAVCLLLRVNIIDMARGSGIGWSVALWDGGATMAQRAGYVFEQVGGIVVTGVVLALAAKFWNEVFDLLFEFKRWLRGHANAMKPEPRSSSGGSGGGSGGGSSGPRTVRRSRSRRRGGDRGGGGGGGGGGANDSPRESKGGQ